MKTLVTGSGLIGSETIAYFDRRGHHVQRGPDCPVNLSPPPVDEETAPASGTAPCALFRTRASR